MVEINFAREILAMAQAFILLGIRIQPIYRVILSRLYYAAHHIGRALLRNAGLAPEHWRVDVQRRVLNELEHRFVNTGTMSRNALEALENLQRMRVRADLNGKILTLTLYYPQNPLTGWIEVIESGGNYGMKALMS